MRSQESRRRTLEASLKNLFAFLGVHADAKGIGEIGGMSGHVDFGYDGDASFLGVGDDFAYFVVGVELAFVAALALILRVVELRIGLALDAPGGMVGQVPVKVVQLVETHQVEGLFEHFDGLVVSSRVVHESAERITWPVVDFNVGYSPIFIFQLL